MSRSLQAAYRSTEEKLEDVALIRERIEVVYPTVQNFDPVDLWMGRPETSSTSRSTCKSDPRTVRSQRRTKLDFNLDLHQASDSLDTNALIAVKCQNVIHRIKTFWHSPFILAQMTRPFQVKPEEINATKKSNVVDKINSRKAGHMVFLQKIETRSVFDIKLCTFSIMTFYGTMHIQL